MRGRRPQCTDKCIQTHLSNHTSGIHRVQQSNPIELGHTLPSVPVRVITPELTKFSVRMQSSAILVYSALPLPFKVTHNQFESEHNTSPKFSSNDLANADEYTAIHVMQDSLIAREEVPRDCSSLPSIAPSEATSHVDAHPDLPSPNPGNVDNSAA